MSIPVPNINDFIERIALLLENSNLLFPQSKGGDETKTDLVNQVIRYELPIPELTIEGPGPPHIFVKESSTPFLQKRQIGRSTIDVQGPEEHTLEFYVIIVTQGTTYKDSQIQMANITQATSTIFKTNQRMLDLTGSNPLCNLLDVIIVPYLLDSEQREILAKNVVLRPKVFVNLR